MCLQSGSPNGLWVPTWHCGSSSLIAREVCPSFTPRIDVHNVRDFCSSLFVSLSLQLTLMQITCNTHEQQSQHLFVTFSHNTLSSSEGSSRYGLPQWSRGRAVALCTHSWVSTGFAPGDHTARVFATISGFVQLGSYGILSWIRWYRLGCKCLSWVLLHL